MILHWCPATCRGAEHGPLSKQLLKEARCRPTFGAVTLAIRGAILLPSRFFFGWDLSVWLSLFRSVGFSLSTGTLSWQDAYLLCWGCSTYLHPSTVIDHRWPLGNAVTVNFSFCCDPSNVLRFLSTVTVDFHLNFLAFRNPSLDLNPPEWSEGNALGTIARWICKSATDCVVSPLKRLDMVLGD